MHCNIALIAAFIAVALAAPTSIQGRVGTVQPGQAFVPEKKRQLDALTGGLLGGTGGAGGAGGLDALTGLLQGGATAAAGAGLPGALNPLASFLPASGGANGLEGTVASGVDAAQGALKNLGIPL
ncbi:hypothetical protein KVR01_013347 [Diaporthe batatas]|uniref:uncharacterized protein n=1 Tax=Diaporthe batatas TaxID=748121 RepID=UPI001D05774C|nr:uncharacterized protein KVR01_013347 [Diaporthe batatas]KAG8156742.1 hypothetical protein KVR01_013347 [Diaporthe batatas]